MDTNINDIIDLINQVGSTKAEKLLQRQGMSYGACLDAIDRALMERERRTRAAQVAQAAPQNDWTDDPASSKQRQYLTSLNVAIPSGYQLTKGAASQIIDAVKRGDGVGTFGLFFTDGSN